MRGNDLEIELRNNLRRAVATAQALDDIDARIGKHRHQISSARFGFAREPILALERSFGQLDTIAMCFPPGDSPQYVRIGIVGAGWTDNANCPSCWKCRSEQ